MTKMIRVLLIEGNPADQRIIEDILSGTTAPSFEVIRAGTVSEALENHRGERADVILLDLNLPDCAGLSGLHRIVQSYSHAPVIIYSAAADEETALGALQEGAYDYLIKDRIDPDLLVRCIRYAVLRRRADDELREARDRLQRGIKERTADLVRINEKLKRQVAQGIKTEKALRESERRFRNLFETSVDAIFIATADGASIDINRAGARILGLGPDEVRGVQTDVIFAHPEERLDLLRKTKRLGYVKNEEITLMRQDSSPVECLITANVVKDRAGRIAGYQGIIRDITEQKRLVNRTLDGVADGVFIINMKKRITYFNAAAERILGIPAPKALRRSYREVVYGGRRKDSVLTRACEERCELLDEEDRFITALGITVPVSLSVSLLADEAGRELGCVVIFRDLSTIVELKKEIEEKYTYRDIVSKNRKIREIFDILPAIAESDSTVLIEGRSGTGKELFARAIHDLSFRKNGPFVAVNCAALPDDLLESELFGYVKGAFSNALRDKPGRFALAQGGTILLDEIGDLKKPLQVKLLGVLERHRYEPLGSVISVASDARVVASTNRDLALEVELGNFREDLFYRINVVRIALPELKERREDITLLVRHFIKKECLRTGKPAPAVSDEIVDFLMDYDFPGNVRELENIVMRMLVLSSGGVIDRRHLPAELTPAGSEAGDAYVSFKDEMMGSEKKMIQEVLARYQGNRALAARALNINRTTLWRKMLKYGILKGEVG